MGRLSDLRDSVHEVLWITRNTLGTFWFWLPIIYMAYVILQLWMMFFVHPLTLAILPVVLVIYGMRMENKRVRLRYGLNNMKRLRASHAFGDNFEPVSEFEWKVEQAVEQYERMLKDEEAEN